MSGIVEALGQAAPYWPWLVVVPLAQFAHELVHFVVAAYYGAAPVIQIRLRTPMRVVYDDRGLTDGADALINAAPALTGLSAAVVWLLVAGWPSFTPPNVIVGVAWLLFTLPSRADIASVGHWLAPEKGWSEPARSIMIGFATIGLGAWLPAILPWPYGFTAVMGMAMGLAAIAYIGVSLYEHGLPEDAAAMDV